MTVNIKPPILTIVTVTLNCVATLEKTLRSVETIKNEAIEYLIIDGVSTDGTLELIQQYDGVIDQLICEPDTGIYNAMNKAVTLARGTYILFINGDDELIQDGFSATLAAMAVAKADIICCTTLIDSINEPSEILIAQPLRLLFFNSIPHPSSFVKTSLLRTTPFREDLRIASDYDFFLRAYLKRKKFIILPSVTALHYRGGASGNQQLSAQEVEQIRRLRLGFKYPFINIAGSIFRLLKKIIS